MRLVIIGQQAFGKAVLDKSLERGHEVAAVFVPPQAPGTKPDPLRAGAQEKGIVLHDPAKYTAPEPHSILEALRADIALMAYVTAFVPQSFVNLPKHGTVQFHPSLLPLHRGPSSINWAVMQGRTETGLTIFRPTDGLDEGPVVLQKRVAIGPDDTTGSIYFDKIFPQGVDAMLEAAELVLAGKHKEEIQDESKATYEGWVKEAECRINWANHVDFTYNIIRGCNPAPGAWTTIEGRKLTIFDARKHIAPTFGQVRGKKLGQITEVSGKGFMIHGQGGFIEVLRCRIGEGPKLAGSEAGLAAGTILGT
jgi:methionyl-tRNA formyltransferase